MSVIIATHNRREALSRCLGALRDQTIDPTLVEVLIIDDGSTDEMAPMAESLEVPFRLRVLRRDHTGKPAALNAGIEAAQGRVCLFLDDDIIASPAPLEQHLGAHRAGPPTLAIGNLVQEAPADGDAYARAYAPIWNQRSRERLGREAEWTDCYGANFSVPRASLVDVGGFLTDVPEIEDLEIAFRLCRSGCTARFLPSATAIHADRKSGTEIIAREERFGAWCAAFAEKHPETREQLFGWFAHLTIEELTLHRSALALRVPTRALAWLGWLVPPRSRRQAWFGFVSRHAFWHGARRAMTRSAWLQTTRGVAVLMYHAFTAGDDIDRFVVARRSFARQMRLLALLRYRVIPLEELAAALADGRDLPRRTVVITIDDGYRDNVEVAEDVLRRHDFPATVFLVSSRLGGVNDWDEDGVVAGRPLLSRAEIDRMREDGMAFGAHTRTHVALTETPDGDVVREVEGSREELEATLGIEVLTFAYPYGLYDDRSVEAVRSAGYHAACTAYARRARAGDNPLMIPRIEISGEDRPLRFLRKLWLGGG